MQYLFVVLRFVPLVLLLVLAIVPHVVLPQTLFASLDVGNIFLFIAALALLGGFTTFSGIPYYIVLVAFAGGGVNPWILGGATALGVALGDLLTYALAYLGHGMFTGRAADILTRAKAFQAKHPYLIPVGIFFYGALVPYSNDVVTIPAGLSRYPLWRVALPLFLGTIVFNTGLALVAYHAHALLIPFI